MIVFAMTVFFIALAGLVALFTLKQWEFSRDRMLFLPMRIRADEEALHVKELLVAARADIQHLPPLLLDAARSVVQGIAVDAGHIAHWLGEQSHRLADSVSHKRNFERRETKSEFLKKVSEHKNGNGNGDEGTTSL
jgi:hypothetical protein